MQSSVRILAIFTAAAGILAGAVADPLVGSSSSSVLGAVQVVDANERFSVSGTVASVNYASNTVTIKANGQTVAIEVTPTTVIDQHGETGSIGDIRKGAKISATGVVKSGRKVALSIVLK
jgi:hypothetical protein